MKFDFLDKDSIAVMNSVTSDKYPIITYEEFTQKIPNGISFGKLSLILSNLVETGYMNHFEDGSYSLTYKAVYYNELHKEYKKHIFVNSVLIPALVSLVVSIITTLIALLIQIQ